MKKSFKQRILLAPDFKTYVSGLLTPWNFIAGLILFFGFYAMVYRLIFGLGPATNLSNEYPWGLWIAFDILAGIALAAPGLTIGTAVYLLGVRDLKEFVRPAIVSSLLGYVFAVLALLLDLGRYYRVYYPIFWSWGLESVLFLVGWHFFLYILIGIVEWLPIVFEWLEKHRLKEVFYKFGIWATALGVIIACGHQAALGGLFLIAPTKLHALWYSPLLPLFFLVSAIFAGISMVIVEGTILHKVFKKFTKPSEVRVFDEKTVVLGKILTVVLGIYMLLKLLDLFHYKQKIYLLFSDYGLLYILELGIFIVIPFIGLIIGCKLNQALIVRFLALIILLGVIFNRIIICIIAYKWYVPLKYKYYPTWMEIAVSLSMITLIILSYRFMIRRLPILSN